MSSDSSDSDEPGTGTKTVSNKTDSESDHNDGHFRGTKGPRTPGSPESGRSDVRSPASSKTRSRTASPATPNSPGKIHKGPCSPPENLDDDGRSNISSGSSIPSEGSIKGDTIDEFDKEKCSPVNKNHFQVPNAEDLSDVSDIDDSDGLADDSKDDETKGKSNGIGTQSPEVQKITKDRDRFERDKRSSLNLDDGEQLDFEAEDQPEGEREDGELEMVPEKKEKSSKDTPDGDKSCDEGEVKEEGAESLEEGEVSDEGDPKPEKPPICRFYSRGACTWGSNCRFLHPGVTDKGNYSMFDMTRPMVASANGLGMYPPEPRPYPMAPPIRSIPAPYTAATRREDPAVESAWERGLRQAKEMMRKSTKRKETDMDFEDKKMNLNIGQEEMDKENDYYSRAASPLDEPEAWARMSPALEPELRRPAVRVVERYEDIIHEPISPAVYDRYDYRRNYEKLRDPEYLLRRDKKYYDEAELARKPGKKMVREVIVERVERERAKRQTAESGRRPDEWADPWMRSKSPGRKGRRSRKVSYSSGSSSYSGSSSRSSSNSSYSSYSRSRSRSGSRSRSQSSGSRSPTSRPRRMRPLPGGIPSRPKLFPDGRDSKFKVLKPGSVLGREGLEKPAAERPMMMNPPAPTPKRPKDLSPSAMRKVGLNPPPPAPKLRSSGKGSKVGRTHGRKSRSSSDSGSSGSSSESSRSSYTSSSSSRGSAPGRAAKKIEPDERLAAATLKGKGVDALKLAGQKQQIKLRLKPLEGKRENLSPTVPVVGKKRPAEEPPAVEEGSMSPSKLAGAKKTTTRREELLKQLKAVEDAIARKRLKI